MSIADRLLESYLKLPNKDRVRIQALAGLGPVAALTALLITVGERYGYRISLVVGFVSSICTAYTMIYFRSKVGERKFFLVGLASLLVCWFVSLLLFASLLKSI